jgi:Mrp family chromosome partitioning ATPase
VAENEPHGPPTIETMAHELESGEQARAVAQARTHADADSGTTVLIPLQGESESESETSAVSLVTMDEAPEIGLGEHSMDGLAACDGRLVLFTEPDSERAARFRVLRHHLMERGRPQVIVVSSPEPGEGKTTCALNLSLALAECGRARVLLVEATVRRPQLAAVFGFTPPWCFAEQLAAHRQQPLLPWGFVNIPDMWLHVAAINPGLGQSQLLDAPAFAIAMERLRRAGYDHIVIDAPAVLGSAEVNLIQDAAEGVVLTCLAGRTTARTLRKAVEQLSPTKILGTVLFES